MSQQIHTRRNERFSPDNRQPGYLHPGGSTAVRSNVQYRLGKLKELGILKGVWLDCGCAEGGYTEALTSWGADRAIGVDPDYERVKEANLSKSSASNTFFCCSASELPFEDASFDGVFLNEVLEHVMDESATLREIRRVLRPKGYLAVMSPNRWFPFEGHGMEILGKKIAFPVPLLPWIPSKFAMPFMSARNYWPSELKNVIAQSGLEIVSTSYILPVFEVYPWLPPKIIQFYRKMMPYIERTPLRKFGVSTFVLATRPE